MKIKLRRPRFSSLIMPSPRLATYCGLGAIFWLAAALVPAFIWLALLYLGVLIVVAAMDWALSPKPAEFELTRHSSERLNLGTPNTIEIQARRRAAGASTWARPALLLVRDEAPVDWPLHLPQLHTKISDEKRVPLLELAVAPDETAQGSYDITPTRRGDFVFGALSARYATPLGLWYRQFSQDRSQTLRVYPDATEVKRYELQLRSGRAHEMGLHRLRHRGQGTEYESLRDYVAGDEFKNVNWKASARLGRLISTNFEIERDQTIILAIDCGRMMTAMARLRTQTAKNLRPSETFEDSATATLIAPPKVADESDEIPLSKLDCAINATVLLAHVAASMGDAVGLLLFDADVRTWIAPRKGRVQTGRIIEALYAAQPELVEPDYSGAYTYLTNRKLRRSLVVTFTDLIDPFASRELLMASGALRRHHNALCVSISNRDVSEMASQHPDSMDDLYQKAMAQQMLTQRGAALENLRRQGVGILDVDASQLTIATVNRYLDLKARGAV